jgi:hypothetical protein
MLFDWQSQMRTVRAWAKLALTDEGVVNDATIIRPFFHFFDHIDRGRPALARADLRNSISRLLRCELDHIDRGRPALARAGLGNSVSRLLGFERRPNILPPWLAESRPVPSLPERRPAWWPPEIQPILSLPKSRPVVLPLITGTTRRVMVLRPNALFSNLGQVGDSVINGSGPTRRNIIQLKENIADAAHNSNHHSL